MTIREAIDRVDGVKPNAFTKFEKINWLSELDGKIFEEIMRTHEDSPTSFFGYTEDTDGLTELLAPAPYDDLYLAWLEAMMDLKNREIVSYNNQMTVFNAKFADFANHWNRTHMPKSERLCFFGRRERRREDPLS